MTRFAIPILPLRGVALALLAIALVLPPITRSRAVYDAVVVLDITGSMNVRDQNAGGQTVSRIAMEKLAVGRLLAGLPCGSKLGLAIFVEKQPFLLFEPVETCENFAPLDSEIGAIDWRMGWDSESHIAETLLASIDMARTLDADLIFMTDGQETPPLSWGGAPNFSQVRGEVQGVIIGVGGTAFAPIPKFNTQGREIGVFKPGDVPSEQSGMFRGREHLSAVDEPHLRRLASESGLAYQHLGNAGSLAPALRTIARPRLHASKENLRWIPAGTALFLLLLTLVPAGWISLRPRRTSRTASLQPAA